MENILIDLLVAFAKTMGISGEGMAGIIGVFLLVTVFLGFVAIGKVIFAGLAWMGHDFSNAKRISFYDEPANHLSLSLKDSSSVTNLNHDL